jgi:hypothetical protein
LQLNLQAYVYKEWKSPRDEMAQCASVARPRF